MPKSKTNAVDNVVKKVPKKPVPKKRKRIVVKSKVLAPVPAKKKSKRKKKNYKKSTVKEYETAIRECHGILGAVALRLNKTRQAVYKMVGSNKRLQDAQNDADEGLTDVAESKLMTLINQADFQAIKLRLERKGRDRGYGQHQTVEHKGNLVIDIEEE